LAIDFHDFNPGIKGYTSLMLVTDRWSDFCWDYYMSDRKAITIIAALEHLFGFLNRQYEIKPKVVEIDNELNTQKPEVKAYLENKQFMKVEPSAPYTGSQLGGAERSGGVVKEKIRTGKFTRKIVARNLVRQLTYTIELPNIHTTGSRHTIDFTLILPIGME
jgi:hypothetical protein